MHDPKIEKLKKRIDNNREERERYNAIYEALQARTREIVEARDKFPHSFWCEPCKADFTGRAHKVVRKLKGKMPIAWYVGYCPAKHRCIRRITEKNNDPYYHRSVIVKVLAGKHRDDILTPNDPRFWLLYGHKHGADHYKNIDKKSDATTPL